MVFLSNRYRPNKWPFHILVILEFPFTVALLALFSIAAPNLYRTKLWQDGSDNGFNSNPNAALYAAANYRPYTAPKVWSQFITDYNVVIAVFSMFFMIAKAPMYIVHVWPPLLSLFVHAILIALYAVSIRYQVASDLSDPKHPQHGAPWYITKSCSVAHNKNNIGYCKQAKSSFACTCIMLGIFTLQFILALWSCFPSKQHKLEREEKNMAKEARMARFSEMEELAPDNLQTSRTATFSMGSLAPRSAGTTGGIKSPMPPKSPMVPMTPRTLAFNRLGGTKDLPLRNHFSSPNAPKSPTYALQSPKFSQSPLSPGFDRAMAHAEQDGEPTAGPSNAPAAMYFPPPPRLSTK